MRTKNRFEELYLIKAIFVLLFIFIIFSKTVFAQDEIIHVDTNLVTVPVTVLDREGRYITNLKKEDFQIFDNGVEGKVDFFESVNEPFTVLLLLDVSGSMVYHMTELANVSSIFVNQLRIDDQLLAVIFNDQINKLFDVKSVKEIRQSEKIRLPNLPDYGDTVVYDAVEYALKKVKKIRGRKAIILFSDGIGIGYSASAKSNLRDAEEGEALIYSIQFNTYPKNPSQNFDKKKYYKRIKIADMYMQSLAQVTGGRHLQVENISNLEKAFAQVANELGQQYSIGYYPKETGKKGERRQIKVKVNIPNAAVRARESYIVGANKN